MANKVNPPVVVPISAPVVHQIVPNKDGTFSIVNGDNGRSHINCADVASAAVEKKRLDALSANVKF